MNISGEKTRAKSIFITLFSLPSFPSSLRAELFQHIFLQHSFYSANKSKAAQLQFLKFSSSPSSSSSSSSSSFLDHSSLSVDTKEN
ncbi:unnamed protein product [Citrullus colocynthis]|uniref:Uncharacterized protein n=1 Tax=Citrullus colocynthis TaxID=252529 RepID=A0ABP0YMS9_9ROSI